MRGRIRGHKVEMRERGGSPPARPNVRKAIYAVPHDLSLAAHDPPYRKE